MKNQKTVILVDNRDELKRRFDKFDTFLDCLERQVRKEGVLLDWSRHFVRTEYLDELDYKGDRISYDIYEYIITSTNDDDEEQLYINIETDGLEVSKSPYNKCQKNLVKLYNYIYNNIFTTFHI